MAPEHSEFESLFSRTVSIDEGACLRNATHEFTRIENGRLRAFGTPNGSHGSTRSYEIDIRSQAFRPPLAPRPFYPLTPVNSRFSFGELVMLNVSTRTSRLSSRPSTRNHVRAALMLLLAMVIGLAHASTASAQHRAR